MIARRLVVFGTAMVFISAVRALEAIGVEDALSYCTGAAIVAVLLTWTLSP